MKLLVALAAIFFLTYGYNAYAFDKWALVAIVFSPDGRGYADHVGAFDTQEDCEQQRKNFLKVALQHYGKEALVVSFCAKPQSLGAVEV